MGLLLGFHKFLENLKKIDFIGFLLIRLYLFYIFWYAGTDKLNTFDQFAEWFQSLGLIFPEVFTWAVIVTEVGGALFLLIGIFVRWVTIPLLIVMANAILLVHWENGWAQESNGIEMSVTYSIMLTILLFQEEENTLVLITGFLENNS